jgi:ribosomal silencing factor RsfS
MGSGWAMIDAGTFAVHVVSKEVREKYLEGNITGMRL